MTIIFFPKSYISFICSFLSSSVSKFSLWWRWCRKFREGGDVKQGSAQGCYLVSMTCPASPSLFIPDDEYFLPQAVHFIPLLFFFLPSLVSRLSLRWRWCWENNFCLRNRLAMMERISKGHFSSCDGNISLQVLLDIHSGRKPTWRIYVSLIFAI